MGCRRGAGSGAARPAARGRPRATRRPACAGRRAGRATTGQSRRRRDACRGCALRDTATTLVFAAGNPAAGLLFVGDAPTAAEDRSGRAFDGPAGAYLERMLASIRVDRETALFTPLIPWRPPGGRPPTANEVAACLPFLHRLIVLTSPRRIVLLGSLAQRAILGAAPRKRTGSWLPAKLPGRPNPLPALAFPSPELLLAKPAGRRDAWADLRLLRRSIDDDLAKM
jgi:uracil-DNA glycosylase family 4